MWLPYTKGKLPETVAVRDPSTDEIVDMMISQDAPHDYGLIEYNVAMMMNVAYDLRNDLPTMSEPIHNPTPNSGTKAHVIRDNVYHAYGGSD